VKETRPVFALLSEERPCLTPEAVDDLECMWTEC